MVTSDERSPGPPNTGGGAEFCEAADWLKVQRLISWSVFSFYLSLSRSPICQRGLTVLMDTGAWRTSEMVAVGGVKDFLSVALMDDTEAPFVRP